jgi:glutamyl-tRNA reductase
MGKKAVIIGADGQMNGLLAEAIIQKGIAAVTLTGKGQPRPQRGEHFTYA